MITVSDNDVYRPERKADLVIIQRRIYEIALPKGWIRNVATRSCSILSPGRKKTIKVDVYRTVVTEIIANGKPKSKMETHPSLEAALVAVEDQVKLWLLMKGTKMNDPLNTNTNTNPSVDPLQSEDEAFKQADVFFDGGQIPESKGSPTFKGTLPDSEIQSSIGNLPEPQASILASLLFRIQQLEEKLDMNARATKNTQALLLPQVPQPFLVPNLQAGDALDSSSFHWKIANSPSIIETPEPPLV